MTIRNRAVVSMTIESTGLQNKVFKALGKKKNYYQHKTAQPVKINLKNERLNKAINRQIETLCQQTRTTENSKHKIQKEKSHAWKI